MSYSSHFHLLPPPPHSLSLSPQAPHCIDCPNLEEALKQAEDSPLRDAPADARLASEHVTTLLGLGGPTMLTDLYTELTAVSLFAHIFSLSPPPSLSLSFFLSHTHSLSHSLSLSLSLHHTHMYIRELRGNTLPHALSMLLMLKLCH